MENIIVALITGAASVIAVVYTNKTSNDKVQKQLEISQAVTEEKIDTLKDEVEKHNKVIERVFKLETNVDNIKDAVNELKEYHK